MGQSISTPWVPAAGAVIPVSVAWAFASLARPCSVLLVLTVLMAIIGWSISAAALMTSVFKVTGVIALLAGPLTVLTVGLCQGIDVGVQPLSFGIWVVFYVAYHDRRHGATGRSNGAQDSSVDDTVLSKRFLTEPCLLAAFFIVSMFTCLGGAQLLIRSS